MYLYFDKKGVLKTQIDHGDKVRQGSPLNVYVCLDQNFFDNLCAVYGYANQYKTISNWLMSLQIQASNDAVTYVDAGENPGLFYDGGTDDDTPGDTPGLVAFEKAFDNEITYDLIPGEYYITYHFNVSPTSSTNYGTSLKLIFTLNSNDYNYALAAVVVDVEKTLGSFKTNINSTQYSKLMGEISRFAETYTIDSAPTEDSTHLVESGGVYSALDLKADKSTTYTKTDTDTLLGGKHPTIDSTHKLSSDLVDDSGTHKFVTAGQITSWNNKVSNIQSDWNASAGLAVILNKPTLATVATSGVYSDLSGKPVLASVATSGSYNDLLDKPIVDSAISDSSTNAIQNKVVYSYVNSSIATNTANFLGTYNLVSDLNVSVSNTNSSEFQASVATALASEISNPTNNDYCFVQIPTSNETATVISRTDRYKYNGSVWGFEYSLNNSGFTAAQWSAINSGVTSSDKTTWNAKQDAIDSGHKLSSDLVDDAGHTNKFVSPSDISYWNAKQEGIDSSHKLSSDLISDTNNTNKFVTQNDITKWNGYESVLSYIPVKCATLTVTGLANGNILTITAYATAEARNTWLALMNVQTGESSDTFAEMLSFMAGYLNEIGRSPLTNQQDIAEFVTMFSTMQYTNGFTMVVVTNNSIEDGEVPTDIFKLTASYISPTQGKIALVGYNDNVPPDALNGYSLLLFLMYGEGAEITDSNTFEFTITNHLAEVEAE